jgi:hypothetical protein
LGGEHHARQNQDGRRNVSDWTASRRRTVIATSDGLVIDHTGGALQLRQPSRKAGAQQYR